MGIHSVANSCDVFGSGSEHNRIKLYISAISNHHPAMTDNLLIAPSSSSYHSTPYTTSLDKRDFFRLFLFSAGPQLLKGDFNKSKGELLEINQNLITGEEG